MRTLRCSFVFHLPRVHVCFRLSLPTNHERHLPHPFVNTFLLLHCGRGKPLPTKVIYMVALTAASLVNAVNILSTLALLKQKKLFIPGGKWSPLSFLQLTHQASREYVRPRLMNFLRTCCVMGGSVQRLAPISIIGGVSTIK